MQNHRNRGGNQNLIRNGQTNRQKGKSRLKGSQEQQPSEQASGLIAELLVLRI